MTEYPTPTERDILIDEVQRQWAAAGARANLTPEELMNTAGHFLANVLLSIAQNEAVAHEIMNRVTEANHLYMNVYWPEIAKKREQLKQEVAKRMAAEGPL